MKNHLIHGLIAGVLAGIAGIIYMLIYQDIFAVDYSLVINWIAILSSSIIGTILMAGGYFALQKFDKGHFAWVLNLVYVVLSFLSIIPPMLMSLPLEVETPELFPGLVVPMHFLPALMFFAIAPLFQSQQE